MNPNQDIIDIIRLNELEKSLDSPYLYDEERRVMKQMVKRTRLEKMRKVALPIPKKEENK